MVRKVPEKQKKHSPINDMWAMINLRISRKMLEQVDECVEKRIGILRTGWILEAILEKIGREW